MKVNLNSLRDFSIFCVRMPRKSLSESGMCDLKFLFGLSERGKLDVIQFCREKGMISSEYECPDCGREMRLVEYKEGVDGYRWRCDWSKEGKRHVVNRSIRGGSWFERSKLGMDDILILTYGWVEKFTNGQLARMARVSSNTATDWCNFCREVCMGICLEESVSIGGEGTTVEIDESMFGKRKHHRGKPVKGRWVFGGVQRGSDECFFEVVKERTKETLLEVIKRRILPGTTVISDCFASYKCLQDEGYKHYAVNHKVTFKDPVTGAHTNTIEGSWSWIKRQLRGKRPVNGPFDPYLAEFMWRKRHKNDPYSLFDSFLRAIIKIYPPIKNDRQRIENRDPGASGDSGSSDDDEEVSQPGPSTKKKKLTKKVSSLSLFRFFKLFRGN